MSKINAVNPQLFGLILAGGKSSRMGFDKGLIEFHGKPQREYLFKLLQQFCAQVFTSCKSSIDIPATLNPLVDQFDIESPLNGILSAFNYNPNVAWLTVPVDMPLVDEKNLAYLIGNRGHEHLATCFLDSEGKNPEPLLALWEEKSAIPLREFHKSGEISPRKFLKSSLVKIIKPVNANVLTNINSTDELKTFLNGREK
jgi:molybdopterin-guanine dinucleotide biosynthesis protein A